MSRRQPRPLAAGTPVYEPEGMTRYPTSSRSAALELCRETATMVSSEESVTNDLGVVMVPPVQLAAVCMFAERELSNTADDDDEPITQEWLEKADFGMLVDGKTPPHPWRPFGKDEAVCGVAASDGEWKFVVEDARCEIETVLKYVKTRGDVRRLFYALDA